jgi:hypothetical protein
MSFHRRFGVLSPDTLSESRYEESISCRQKSDNVSENHPALSDSLHRFHPLSAEPLSYGNPS